MNKFNRILTYVSVVLFAACETEYFPSTDIYEKQLTVESYLELSNETVPPFCILTSSIPYTSGLDTGVINNIYVRGAQVSVEYNNQKVILQEFCLSQLQEPFRSELIRQFGFDPDSVQTDFCAYLDIAREIVLQPGDFYTLEIVFNGDTTRSIAQMPLYNNIDSFWFEKPPGRNNNDTFAQLYCIISDNPLVADYYRYYTAGQGERLIPDLNSVTDDVFFDGKSFEFSLFKARGLDEEFDDNTGLFRRGDTIRVKWCNIPKEHFQFWNSLEASRTRQGPFSSYVRIEGNIPGALGIFGTQHCRTYTLIVPKE